MPAAGLRRRGAWGGRGGGGRRAAADGALRQRAGGHGGPGGVGRDRRHAARGPEPGAAPGRSSFPAPPASHFRPAAACGAAAGRAQQRLKARAARSRSRGLHSRPPLVRPAHDARGALASRARVCAAVRLCAAERPADRLCPRACAPLHGPAAPRQPAQQSLPPQLATNRSRPWLWDSCLRRLIRNDASIRSVRPGPSTLGSSREREEEREREKEREKE